MAKVFKVKSELKANKNKNFLYSVFALFFGVLFTVAGIALFIAILLKKLSLTPVFPILFLVLGLVLLIIYAVWHKRFDILSAGVRGEKETLEVLQKLPKGYTVITNPVIHTRGAFYELDFAVIGENGVFVVETKNYRGIIRVKASQQTVKQIKHGKNNKVYEKEVKNPVRQSARQGAKMREILTDMGICADVFPVLYFTDSRSEISITDDNDCGVAMLKTPKALLDYITQTAGLRAITQADCDKIARIFKS